MKRVLVALFLVVSGTSCTCTGADSDTRRAIALVAIGDVQPALVTRAKEWAETNLAVPVPVWKARAEEAATLDDAGEWASEKLKPQGAGVIVLSRPPEGVTTHGIYNPEKRFVVINVRAMSLDGADEEKVARRVERQVMRGMGMLAGLETSPNPFSAMASYGTLEELDAIGRNLDPPWLERFQEQMRAWGIAMDAENPFYLLR